MDDEIACGIVVMMVAMPLSRKTPSSEQKVMSHRFLFSRDPRSEGSTSGLFHHGKQIFVEVA